LKPSPLNSTNKIKIQSGFFNLTVLPSPIAVNLRFVVPIIKFAGTTSYAANSCFTFRFI
jgi:hypothetical protein